MGTTITIRTHTAIPMETTTTMDILTMRIMPMDSTTPKSAT